MADSITKRVWENGALKDKTYELSATVAVTSPTALHDIVKNYCTSLGMTDDSIPGNETIDGFSTNVATQAQAAGILV